MEAVRRKRAGESAAAIAADLGVGANAVHQWDKQARVHGIESLKLKPRTGRKVKLDKMHWRRLREMVLAGPRACGFDTEPWTLPLIAELIQTEVETLYDAPCLHQYFNIYRGLTID